MAFERAVIERSRHPVYYTTRVNIPDVEGWRLVPAPLCYRMVAVSDSVGRIGDEFWRRCDFRALDRSAVGKDYWTRKLVANYHYSFAEFLMAGGDSTRAFGEFRQAGKIAFDSKVMHFNIASHYVIAGQIDAAIEELKVALSIDPYFTRASTRMEQLYARKRRQE
jgi:tetratricopeptide (TPR) repeat protein